MNHLSTAKRVAVVSCLVEGNSVRSTCRLTGVAKGTVLKLLGDMGDVCTQYHNERVRFLDCKRIQADEIWSFVHAKQRVASQRDIKNAGDAWTWVAMDPDTKLIISYLVGERTEEYATAFLKDVYSRLKHPCQLTTDANFSYLNPVNNVFGEHAAYAQILKIYQANRYVGSEKKIIRGKPDPKHISTSIVERQNLNMRSSMRRFTRKTNGFSKKLQNLRAAVALNFMYHNYCRIHTTIRVTPAMQAGLVYHPWTITELVGLLDKRSILHGIAH